MWDQNFSFSTIIFSTMFSHEFKNGYEMTFFLKWFPPFQNTKKKKSTRVSNFQVCYFIVNKSMQ